MHRASVASCSPLMTLARPWRAGAHGAELLGEMHDEGAYIRGPEGIIVGLAEERRPLSWQNVA